MKDHLTIAFSADILTRIDERAAVENSSRSELITKAVIEHLERAQRQEQFLSDAAIESRELEIINRNADLLNSEAADLLEYQVPL